MSSKSNLIAKIKFIEDQLESLNHFLPETYQYLMEELDYQEKELMKIKIKLFDSEQFQWMIPPEPTYERSKINLEVRSQEKKNSQMNVPCWITP